MTLWTVAYQAPLSRRFSSKNSGMDFHAFIHGISPDPGIEPISLTSPVLTGRGFPGGSEDKASACNAGDSGSIPGLGRSPGEGNGNQLQYSCLENPMDRGAWQVTVHRVANSQTQLSDFTFTFLYH